MKRKNVKIPILILAIVLLVLFTSCTSSSSFNFNDYLGTYSSISFQGNTELNITEFENILERVDNVAGIEKSSSDIYKFNHASAGDTIEISFDAYNLLTKCKELYLQTKGYFNPAIGGLIDLWGFSPRFSQENNAKTIDGHLINTLPLQDYINGFVDSNLIDFGKVILKSKDNKYYISKPDVKKNINGVNHTMQLNLGGIAKGYCADLCSEHIKASTSNYTVSIGMSSIYCGTNSKDADGNYLVEIQHPRATNFVEVKSKNEGASTSGDYQHCFFVNGKRYSHILNPFTGYPIDNGVISVSLFGIDATTLDALSTAVMLMGIEEGTSFLKNNYPSCKYIFTHESNNELSISTNYAKSDIKILDSTIKVNYEQ